MSGAARVRVKPVGPTTTGKEQVPEPRLRSAAPVRTCVGCRRAVPARELLGVTLAEGQLCWGARGARTGRGAWIHPARGCLVAAARNHGFSRAFRTAIPGFAAEGVESLVQQIQDAFDSQQRRNG